MNEVNPAKKFITKGKFRQASNPIVSPENSGLRFVINPIDVDAKFENPVNVVIAKKWKQVRAEGKAWHANRTNFKLGEHQSVAVQSDVWVMNTVLLSEQGLVTKEALEIAFKKIAAVAKYEKASLHMAEDMLKLGHCKELAEKYFLNEGLNVYIYKL